MTLFGYCDDSDKPLRDPYHQEDAQLTVNRMALAVTRSAGGGAIALEAARGVLCYKRRQTIKPQLEQGSTQRVFARSLLLP